MSRQHCSIYMTRIWFDLDAIHDRDDNVAAPALIIERNRMCHFPISYSWAPWRVSQSIIWVYLQYAWPALYAQATPRVIYLADFVRNSFCRSGPMYRKPLQKEPARRIGHRSNMRKDEGTFDAREQCCTCAGASYSGWRYTRPVLRLDRDL